MPGTVHEHWIVFENDPVTANADVGRQYPTCGAILWVTEDTEGRKSDNPIVQVQIRKKHIPTLETACCYPALKGLTTDAAGT